MRTVWYYGCRSDQIGHFWLDEQERMIGCGELPHAIVDRVDNGFVERTLPVGFVNLTHLYGHERRLRNMMETDGRWGDTAERIVNFALMIHIAEKERARGACYPHVEPKKSKKSTGSEQ